jgi:hypothetical protein
MSGLRHDRHNSALRLLFTLLEHSNGGHWETILADFGNKPIKRFTADSFNKPHPQLDTPFNHHSHMQTRRVYVDEGLDHSSLTRCPAVLPKDILATRHRPPYLIIWSN